MSGSQRSSDLRTALRIGLGSFAKHRTLGALFMAAVISQAALQAGLIWVLREVLRGFGHPDSAITGSMVAGAALVLAVWIARALATFAGDLVAARLAHRVENDWLLRLLRKLLTMSVRFFDRTRQGDIALASYHDVKSIRLISLEVGKVVLHLARLAGLAGVAWMMSPKLAAIGLLLLPLGLLPAHRMARRLVRAADQEREAIAGMSDDFLQVSSGIRVIKVNRGEASVLRHAHEHLHQLYEVALRQVQARGMGRLLFESVIGAGLVLVLVLGGRDIASGTLEWESLLSLLIALLAVYSPVISLISVQQTVLTMLPNLDRLNAILNAPVEVPDRPDAARLRAAPERIRLEQVSFAYDSRPVLSELSLTFHRGERIGIVGPSGAGKSTLIALLLRLYDPTSGRITLDGVDLRDVRHADLLDLCAIVPQEPFLFQDTVGNNIRATVPDATAQSVERAARAANVHEEIMAMERGYDTLLGRSKHARGLSTGQKQRLAIASALLKDAPILFLDEATSSLDSVSERAVQTAIERLVEGRTTFVIAHRLSTLRIVNRILVLDQGQLVGFDTHDELWRTCPVYQRLWHHQSLHPMPGPGGPPDERVAEKRRRINA